MSAIDEKFLLIGHVLEDSGGKKLIFHAHSEERPIHLAEDVIAHPKAKEKIDEVIFNVQLGQLVSCFQSLEFMLRIFLHKLPMSVPLGIPYGTDIYTLPVGTEIPESEITDYDTLGDLIKRFNKAHPYNLGQSVDLDLVITRDAIAHGRASSSVPSGSVRRLIKFGKAINGRTKVTYNQEMNASWFDRSSAAMKAAIQTVEQALASLPKSSQLRP